MKSLRHSDLDQECYSYAYFQNKYIFRNFAYYNFSWRLSFQPLEEDWATLGVLNTLNGINIVNLWLIYTAIRAYLKNCILQLTAYNCIAIAFYNFCWTLDFQPWEEDWATSGVLNMLNGINIAMAYRIFWNSVGHDVASLWPIYAAIRMYLKNYILQNFAIYNFC